MHNHIYSGNFNNLRPLGNYYLPPTTNVNSSPVTLNMALLNVCSLLNKSFILNDLVLDAKLDYLFVTEIWLGTDAPVVLTEASPPGFKFSFYARSGRKGGGPV